MTRGCPGPCGTSVTHLRPREHHGNGGGGLKDWGPALSNDHVFWTKDSVPTNLQQSGCLRETCKEHTSPPAHMSGGKFHKATALRKSLRQPVTAERGRTRILFVCCTAISILSSYLYRWQIRSTLMRLSELCVWDKNKSEERITKSEGMVSQGTEEELNRGEEDKNYSNMTYSCMKSSNYKKRKVNKTMYRDKRSTALWSSYWLPHVSSNWRNTKIHMVFLWFLSGTKVPSDSLGRQVEFPSLTPIPRLQVLNPCHRPWDSTGVG